MGTVKMAKKYQCNGTTPKVSLATGVRMRTINMMAAVAKESDTVDTAVKTTIRLKKQPHRRSCTGGLHLRMIVEAGGLTDNVLEVRYAI
jgi:hypothetical protein